jgi:SAM-dependent methyltransferase
MFDSKEYWESRYKFGGTSGDGSYGKLAKYKAEVLNKFVDDHHIHTVLEFGCGDGHQLSLAKYPIYKGIDISDTAIQLCKQKFDKDLSKVFLTQHDETKAELVLSLDVLFHVIDYKEWQRYINRLFLCATKFVIIYSCDEEFKGGAPHFKPRKFTNYIKENIEDWELKWEIQNEYPYNPLKSSETSVSDFYIYTKCK